jgi:hypothetical protein
VRLRLATIALLLASQAGGLAWRGFAADAPADSGATVALPPMLVEESTSSVPWLYVNAGGTEFLSRCSTSTTRHLAEAWLEKLQLVRVLVPEAFLARMDVPEIFILYAQDLEQTVSAEIQRELQGGGGRSRPGESPRSDGVNIAPSMRLSDRDMHASIAYIDEALFDAAGLSVSPGHVRFLLQSRVPELPAWVIDGVERTYRRADFVMEPVTLGPLIWHDAAESSALLRDPGRPRALLSASELFLPDSSWAKEERLARRRVVKGAQAELFFRWAHLAGDRMRDAYWKLAARAAEGRVTEEGFEALFGFDFAEWRDRLSDYLPKALYEHKWLDPRAQATLVDVEVRRATPGEVARVRGEWERLAIGHVRRRLPEVREPYIAQARRTLRRAFDAGDRDPRLLATMGLCEIDAGNEAGARQFLEPAIAGGVKRPRAHYELARLRFAELRHGAADTRRFSFTELAPIIEPLRRALTQAPPLAEVYELLADAWARCEFAPTAAEFAELEAGLRYFSHRPMVVLPVALAFARHGKRAEASAILETSVITTLDEASQALVDRWRAELAAALAEGVPEQLPNPIPTSR